MAMVPMRRNPLTSLLNFAAERDREAMSLGDVISQIAKPVLSGMGVQTDETTPQAAVMRGPVPTAKPIGPMTGPAMAPTPVMSKEELKANVFPGESGGDYNALFGYSNRPGGKFEGVKLTDMTVNEVAEFTDPKGPYGQWVKDQIGYVATPTGAFQTVGTTLKDAMRGLGLTGDEPYDQNTQDAIGMWIYENQGPEAWEGWNKGTMTAGGGDVRLGGGQGADTLGTGGNVEDILAQLYPQMSPEEEKKQRRNDFFTAAGQGLSAVVQGRPVDLSNIRQAQEQRRTQAVQDMRERERARAAGNLVFSQTGDRDLTSAVVTGAISYNDVVSERERKRVEAEADRVRLQQEQANDRLTGIVESMWPELGLPDSVKEEVLAGIAAGDDPNTIFTLNEQAKVAEAARKAEEQEAEDAETRAAAIDAFSTQGGPVEQYAARLLTFDPKLTIDQALERSTKLMRPEADGQAGTAIGYADALVAAGAINQATGKPYTRAEALAATILPPQGGGGGPSPMITVNPDGSTTITLPSAAPAAPAAAAPAQAAGAPVAGGAFTGVAGAFNQQFGGMETGIPTGAPAPAPAVAAQTLPLDVAQGVADLEKTVAQTTDIGAQTQVRLQELSQAIAEAPDQITKLALENEELQLRIREAQARTDVAPEVQEATLANLQADLEKKQTELATLEADAEKQKTAEYANATRSFSVFENAAKDVLKNADNAWTTGTYGKIAMSLLPDNFATQRSSFLEAAKQMGSQAMLSALAEAKAAGVTLTPVSNLDVGALGASQSRLSNPEKLTGEDIRKEVVFQLNFAKDALVGPKDLTRVDEFGQPYKTDADTLGLTEDTFARHWREIPPAVAEAWRNGELDALPTDDPLYAEAADTLNQHINNWQTYQGDLDRATVGVLPTPPEGIDAEEWPDVWLELSVGERAAYRKQAKKGNQ